MTHTSVGFAYAVSMILALTGYLSFVDTTQADLLNNFADDVSGYMQVFFFSFSSCFTSFFFLFFLPVEFSCHVD